jgi:hypothetical protein
MCCAKVTFLSPSAARVGLFLVHRPTFTLRGRDSALDSNRSLNSAYIARESPQHISISALTEFKSYPHLAFGYLSEDIREILGGKPDALPRNVRETSRIAQGSNRGQRFGVVLHLRPSPLGFLAFLHAHELRTPRREEPARSAGRPCAPIGRSSGTYPEPFSPSARYRAGKADTSGTASRVCWRWRFC